MAVSRAVATVASLLSAASLPRRLMSFPEDNRAPLQNHRQIRFSVIHRYVLSSQRSSSCAKDDRVPLLDLRNCRRGARGEGRQWRPPLVFRW